MKIGVYILGLVAVCWWFYHMGENAANLTCQETMAEINRLSIESKRISDEAIRNEETLRITQAQDAELRIQTLAKRLDIARRTKPTPALGASMCDCRISDDAVRVLAETAGDPRIPPPDNPAGFVDSSEAVTADTVTAYSFYAITEYNKCSADMNALQNMVR